MNETAHAPLPMPSVERFGEMFDGEEGWMLVSCPIGEYVKYEVYASQSAEIAGLREALEKIADPKRLASHGDPTVLRDAAREALEPRS